MILVRVQAALLLKSKISADAAYQGLPQIVEVFDSEIVWQLVL